MNEVFINVYQGDHGRMVLGAEWETREAAHKGNATWARRILLIRVRPKAPPTPKWEDMP